MLTFEHLEQKNNQNEKTIKDIFRYRRIKRSEILEFSNRILLFVFSLSVFSGIYRILLPNSMGGRRLSVLHCFLPRNVLFRYG